MMKNPILPGFYPDPTICRKGEWYYIANSTFQWWPGIPIHRSRDLRHWEFAGHALTQTSQADLSRTSDSSGIWAPDLTWDGDAFWLCFTIVSKQQERVPFTANYCMTAEAVTGPWSEPVYLHSMGYDHSMFHAPDGRKYVVSMHVDDTPGARTSFAGITLQEYDTGEKRLVGRPEEIFKGTELDVTEGPHVYYRNGWYYLLTAEGGTLYGHAVTCARSRELYGPYDVRPGNPILTAAGRETLLQKTGHADMIEVTPERWAMVYLAARPVDRKCMLGRETCIQSIIWKDDWPWLEQDGPSEDVPDFGIAEYSMPKPEARDDFDTAEIRPGWLTPRVPAGSWLDLYSRPGWLRLHSLPTVLCNVEPVSFLARRIQHHAFRAETLMEFTPESTYQHAGLVCYYDTTHWYFLSKHRNPQKEMVVSVRVYDLNEQRYATVGEVCLDDERGQVRLAVESDGRVIKFLCTGLAEEWKNICEPQDALILSDDYVFRKVFAFTGALVGIAAWDRWGLRTEADFDYFEYEPND